MGQRIAQRGTGQSCSNNLLAALRPSLCAKLVIGDAR